MARVDKRRAKSTKPHAPVAAARPRPAKAPSYEDTMFFSRLRRHAKWVFVLLAVAMGGGFVIFGVGAGGVGIGDVFRGSGSSDDSPSISEAREETVERPNDPEAWRTLATALQTEGETAEAIDALEQVTRLSPDDQTAYRELGGAYLARAQELSNLAQRVQVDAIFGGASTQFTPRLEADGTQVLEGNAIAGALERAAVERIAEISRRAQEAYAGAVDTYQQLSALAPDDPNLQLELATTAQQANDAATAITAYRRFLELAPDDPNAPIVREQLQQLSGASSTPGG